MELKIEKEIRQAVIDELNNMGYGSSNMLEDEILTARETVDYIGNGLSYSTLMRECRKGNMPCFRIGNKVYFRKSKLIEWIMQQEGSTANGSEKML